MDLELNPGNCSIVGQVIEQLCPGITGYGNGVTYDSISVQPGYTGLPSKEVFEAALIDYVNNIPWAKLREERTKLLVETDFLVLPDYTHSSEDTRQAWLVYRQALRDLPVNTSDPTNPTWPTKPSA